MRRYSGWRIGKRWRKSGKFKSNKPSSSSSSSSSKDVVDDNHTTTTPRTSRISNASSGEWTTDCASYGDAASLSDSVGSGGDGDGNEISQEKQKQQQRQNADNQFSAFVDRVKRTDKMKTKKKQKNPELIIEADPSKPIMPKITEEYDLSFGKKKGDSKSSSSNSESDSDEYEDIIETDDECDDDEDDDDDDDDGCHETFDESHYYQRFSADHHITPSNPLPETRELSKVLCRIVFGMGGKPHGRNRRRALTALSKVSAWVDVADRAFVRDFLTYGGMPKILDFLQDLVMESNEGDSSGGGGGVDNNDESDSSDSDDDRRRQLRHGGAELIKLRTTIEGIRNTSRVISGVHKRGSVKEGRSRETQEGNNKSRSTRNSPGYAAAVTAAANSNDENLGEMMATGVVNHGGIDTLLRASYMCCQSYNRHRMFRIENRSASATFDGEAVSLVEAAEEVWTAIANTCTSSNDETASKIVDGVSVSVWDAGLTTMETFSEGIGLGSFGESRDSSGHTSRAVAAAAAPPAIAVLLLNTSVFRAFETILIRRRGDPLVTRNLFAEQRVLSRAVKLIPGPRKTDDTPVITFTINDSPKGMDSLHSSLHSQMNWSQHSSIDSCSIQSLKNSDSTISEEEEAFLLEEALSFFYECHTQELLFRKNTRRKVLRSNASDERWFPCEGMIPLCVAGVQKFGADNYTIRRKALRILDAALDSCSKNNNNSNNNKMDDDHRQTALLEMIEGVIETLAQCLISNRINETEKDKFRALIHKIAAMESDRNKQSSGSSSSSSSRDETRPFKKKQSSSRRSSRSSDETKRDRSRRSRTETRRERSRTNTNPSV